MCSNRLTFTCHLQIDADPDPDPVYPLDADPDPDSGSQNDADPCGSGSTTLYMTTKNGTDLGTSNKRL
jgi:hypothetical protein